MIESVCAARVEKRCMPASVTPRTGGSSKRKCRLTGGVAVEGVRKTAGRGTQNCYATVRSQPNSWSGRLEQLLLNYTGWKARRNPAAGEVFFLTFPFIELIRTWPLRLLRTASVALVAGAGGRKKPQSTQAAVKHAVFHLETPRRLHRTDCSQ